MRFAGGGYCARELFSFVLSSHMAWRIWRAGTVGHGRLDDLFAQEALIVWDLESFAASSQLTRTPGITVMKMNCPPVRCAEA